MRRKVFLSAVGTGNYLNCNYYYQEQKVDDVQYIQSAIYKIFCKDFKKTDKVIFAFTDSAKTKHEDSLKTEFNNICHTNFSSISIPNGESEDELWNIFKLFNECIEYQDEVILDVTHSFRSLPIVFIMLLQYLKTTKEISISGLYYGAFEKLGKLVDVQNMHIENRNAPIFDLTPFISLHDWSQAVNNFSKFGKVDLLQKLSKQKINPILKDSQGSNQVAKSIDSIIKQLKTFSDYVITCRGKEIYDMNLKTDIYNVICNLQQNMLPQLEPVLDNLKTNFKDSHDKEVLNGLFAVKWCIQHNLIQQGYTLLQETIISIVEQNIQLPHESVNTQQNTRNKRKFVSSFLNCYEIPENEWQFELKRFEQTALKYRCPQYKQLAEIYRSLSEKRNDINHAGFVDNSSTFDKLENKLKEFYQQTSDILNLPNDLPSNQK